MDGSGPRTRAGVSRKLRLVGLAVGVTLLIVAVMIVPTWASAVTSPSQKRAANTAFLNALLVAYLGTVGVSVAGVLAFAAGLSRKGPRNRRLWMAKFLLLSTTCLFGVAAMEVTAFAWEAWKHRSPELVAKGPPPPPQKPYDPLDYVGEESGANADESGPLKILILGESSARGEPYQDWLSVGQILGWQLEKAFPGRAVEVDMQAQPGVPLEPMHQKLATIDYRPDVIVLFSGHNEFQGRYSWSRNVVHYDYERPQAEAISPVALMLKNSPVCALILETLDKQKMPVAPKKVVTRGVVDGPAFVPWERAAVLEDFRRRLDSIASYCERIGTVPVFVCPASNDRDFDPSRSILAPETTREEIAAFTGAFLEARALVETEPAEAKSRLAILIDAHPEYAEAHYWYARLLEADGEWEDAREHYLIARERDGHPIRCPDDFREAYREVAKAHSGVVLVDSDVVLTPLTEHGVLSDHQYHDAHHPTFLSYVALTQNALDQIADRRLLGWPEGAPAPRIDPEECRDHFKLDQEKWATVLDRTASFFERTAYMKFDPTERNRKAAIYAEASRKVAAGLAPEDTGLPGVGTRPTEAPASSRPEASDGSGL